MSSVEKTAVVSTVADSLIRAQVFMGLTGSSPMTGSSRSNSPMMRNSSVAAALAVLPGKDDSPSVIRQFTSIFLVSRAGELWRVYDADSPDSVDRQMPSPGSRLSHRVFVALATTEQLRVHKFAERETHDIDPSVLQQQLDDSTVV
jgi:hypothetical protein